MSACPTPIDGFPSRTASEQTETEEVLRAHAPVAGATPVLDKNNHMKFLVKNLRQGFPSRYLSQDASQPWLMFWTLEAFSILSVALDPGNKQRAIDKIVTWQHPDGGFGGGPGQSAHLLPTYASVASLAIVGRPGPGGGWDQIDRTKMYNFFMSLKQPDGSFLVSRHGEVDVRGIYCMLVTATILDIITPELVEGTAGFIASCQTYEGGFASSSHPFFGVGSTLLQSPRPALGEAHGGYTYCAAASWVLLQPFLRTMKNPPTINTKNLLRWLTQMQGLEVELGGFKGRTNKLVDGCYSWWVGGTFPLLEAMGVHASHSSEPVIHAIEDDSAWFDVDDFLYDREALQEYIICAGQHPSGGLRDKPQKGPDAYHTLYCLAGLSSAQHTVTLNKARREAVEEAWIGESGLRKEIFLDAISWIEDPDSKMNVIGKNVNNRLNASHPLFNLTVTHSDGILAHMYKQALPPDLLKKI